MTVPTGISTIYKTEGEATWGHARGRGGRSNDLSTYIHPLTNFGGKQGEGLHEKLQQRALGKKKNEFGRGLST